MDKSESFGTNVNDLKAHLRQAVHDALVEFRNATGVSPSAVTVQLIELTSHGDITRRFDVSDVRLKFEEV